MRILHLLLLCAWSSGSALGCSSDSPPSPEPPPKGDTALGDEPIPEDFTFQSTRPLALEVMAQAGGGEQEESRRLRVEVRSQGYGVMYRGNLNSGESFRFAYPLPADVTELELLTTDDSGVTTSQKVAVDPTHLELSIVVGSGS